MSPHEKGVTGPSGIVACARWIFGVQEPLQAVCNVNHEDPRVRRHVEHQLCLSDHIRKQRCHDEPAPTTSPRRVTRPFAQRLPVRVPTALLVTARTAKEREGRDSLSAHLVKHDPRYPLPGRIALGDSRSFPDRPRSGDVTAPADRVGGARSRESFDMIEPPRVIAQEKNELLVFTSAVRRPRGKRRCTCFARCKQERLS
jgi:hypothetical protein